MEGLGQTSFDEIVIVARAVLDDKTPITSGKAQILARWVIAEANRRQALRLAMVAQDWSEEDE